MLFTCGWAITGADEQAIRLLPASGWQAAVDQDGAVQHDKHVAEITHLMRRAGRWPAGLRSIVRRTRPSRRQARNLTAFERATGWRYSIIVTNIPAAGGIGGVPGSHHAQFIDVLHRQHAVVEDGALNRERLSYLAACGCRNCVTLCDLGPHPSDHDDSVDRAPYRSTRSSHQDPRDTP